MIENIKEIFLPKTGMREKQLLQDPGSKGSKVHAACCMVHCTLQGCMKYPMWKELKEIKIAIIQSNISYVEAVESPFDLQCRF